MFNTIILLSIISITATIYYLIRRYKKMKIKINLFNSKIQGINKTIVANINGRKKEPYYNNLKESYKHISNKISKIHLKVNKHNLKYLNEVLILTDNHNIYLNKHLSNIDSFIIFEKEFSAKKRKYKQTFNKSLKTLKVITDRYGKSILKHINDFNIDYNVYKQNEITKLNSYIKKCKEYANNYDLKNLHRYYTDIEQLDTELNIRLSEPTRLLEKLSLTEETLTQLETELDNQHGSLYFKTFNIIKSHKVTTEETSEWNALKKKINYYKKNRLLKTDIIKLNKDLSNIINSMVFLCDRITTTTPVHNIKIESNNTFF